MSSLILHIGWPKCGSTTIQNSLFRFGRPHGKVSVPNSLFIENCIPKSSLPSKPNYTTPALFTPCLNYGDGHLRLDFENGCIAISSENLAYAPPHEDSSQIALVVCVVRSPASWLQSQWSHKVVHEPIATKISDFSTWVDSDGAREYEFLVGNTVRWSGSSNFSIFKLEQISDAVAKIRQTIGLETVLNQDSAPRRLNRSVGVKTAKLLHHLRKIAQSDFELTDSEWSDFVWHSRNLKSFENLADLNIWVDRAESSTCSDLCSQFNSRLGDSRLSFDEHLSLEIPKFRESDALNDVAHLLLTNFFRRQPLPRTFDECAYMKLRPDVLEDFLRQNPAADSDAYRIFMRRHFSMFGAMEANLAQDELEML